MYRLENPTYYKHLTWWVSTPLSTKPVTSEATRQHQHVWSPSWTQLSPVLHPSIPLSPFLPPPHHSLLPISDVICEVPQYRADTHSLRAGWSPELICFSNGRRRKGLGDESSTGWAWESAAGNGKIFYFSILFWEKPKSYLAQHSEPWGTWSRM